jgi:hypothetical protein
LSDVCVPKLDDVEDVQMKKNERKAFPMIKKSLLSMYFSRHERENDVARGNSLALLFDLGQISHRSMHKRERNVGEKEKKPKPIKYDIV